MKIQTIIYRFMYGSSTGQLPYTNPYSRPEVDTQGLYRDPVSVNDTPGIRYRQYGQSTLGEGFHRSSITSVDPLGSRKKYRLANRYVAGKRSSKPDDFAFILPSFSYPCPRGVSSFDRMKGSWSWSCPFQQVGNWIFSERF